MTNRIRDASWIESVGYGSRHGPYARGEPLIRGKPTMGIGVSNSNTTDLESPPPDTVISIKERSPSNEVTVNNMRFLSCFLRSPFFSSMSPLGTSGVEGSRGKPEGKGARSWLQWESRVLAAKKPVDEVGVFIPSGDCFAEIEAPPNLPKGKGQEKKGKESQSQFSLFSPERATGNSPGRSPGDESNVDFIVPRSVVVQGGAVAWGKTANVENCSKLTTTIINMSKKHDLKVFPSRGENPEGKRGQKNNTINKISITGMRFRVEPGMTKKTISNIKVGRKSPREIGISLCSTVAVCNFND